MNAEGKKENAVLIHANLIVMFRELHLHHKPATSNFLCFIGHITVMTYIF